MTPEQLEAIQHYAANTKRLTENVAASHCADYALALVAEVRALQAKLEAAKGLVEKWRAAASIVRANATGEIADALAGERDEAADELARVLDGETPSSFTFPTGCGGTE